MMIRLYMPLFQPLHSWERRSFSVASGSFPNSRKAHSRAVDPPGCCNWLALFAAKEREDLQGGLVHRAGRLLQTGGLGNRVRQGRGALAWRSFQLAGGGWTRRLSCGLLSHNWCVWGGGEFGCKDGHPDLALHCGIGNPAEDDVGLFGIAHSVDE